MSLVVYLHFPNLENWVFIGNMDAQSGHSTLYALAVSPMRAAWIPLLWLIKWAVW